MINSKRKGKVGELELVNILKDRGLTARRTQQYSGTDGTSDVLCDELNDFHIEVKRDERLNVQKALTQAENDSMDKVPIVVHRKNREKWKVTLYLDDFLDKVVDK
jgi:Holliday junction resolvase